MSLGAFLRQARRDARLTLRAVEAATSGAVSNGYLSQLENGKITSPSPHVLHALSMALGIPYDTLLEHAGYIMPAPRRSRDAEIAAEAAARERERVREQMDNLITRAEQASHAAAEAVAERERWRRDYLETLDDLRRARQEPQP